MCAFFCFCLFVFFFLEIPENVSPSLLSSVAFLALFRLAGGLVFLGKWANWNKTQFMRVDWLLIARVHTHTHTYTHKVSSPSNDLSNCQKDTVFSSLACSMLGSAQLFLKVQWGMLPFEFLHILESSLCLGEAVLYRGYWCCYFFLIPRLKIWVCVSALLVTDWLLTFWTLVSPSANW